MKTKLLICNIRKGGVGKTTIATNLAVCLAKNHKVLLMDLDPQGHVLLHFGLDPKIFTDKTIREVIEKQLKLETCLLDKGNLDHIDSNVIANLDILPSNYQLKFLTEERPLDAKEWIINGIEKIVKSDRYDYVVIDTSPDWNTLTADLFNLADAWVTPFTPTLGAEDGLIDLIDGFKQVKKEFNKKLKIFIIPNNVTFRKRRDKETGETKIVETVYYQILNRAKTYAKDIKDVFFAEPINKSDQYEYAIAGCRMPITAVTDKTLKQFKKPAKQQRELSDFILDKFGEVKAEPVKKVVNPEPIKVTTPKKATAKKTKKTTKKGQK